MIDKEILIGLRAAVHLGADEAEAYITSVATENNEQELYKIMWEIVDKEIYFISE